MYSTRQDNLVCVNWPFFKYETLTWGGGLGWTYANPCIFQFHDATKLSFLHDAGPTPPIIVLEPTLLTEHAMQYTNKQKMIL
jgi:hypothetical protein